MIDKATLIGYGVLFVILTEGMVTWNWRVAGQNLQDKCDWSGVFNLNGLKKRYAEILVWRSELITIPARLFALIQKRRTLAAVKRGGVECLMNPSWRAPVSRIAIRRGHRTTNETKPRSTKYISFKKWSNRIERGRHSTTVQPGPKQERSPDRWRIFGKSEQKSAATTVGHPDIFWVSMSLAHRRSSGNPRCRR
jgi:hypothetical protein